MIGKEIKFTDYNGEPRKETHYFNLTKAEIAEMELTTEGGLEQRIRKIIEAKNTGAIVEIMKRIILDSYGIKSDDGRRFIKNLNGVHLADEFKETEAYSTLFMELATNAEAAVEFLRGIVPEELRKELTNQQLNEVREQMEI